MMSLVVVGFVVAVASASSGPLSARIVSGLKLKYPLSDIERVLRCWDNFEKGVKLERFVNNDPEIHQQADCFVDGLNGIVLSR